MKSFKQYIVMMNEIFDKQVDAKLVSNLAKHSKNRLLKDRDLMFKLGGDPKKIAKITQQIKNRESTSERLRRKEK
jgi:hypothetical protein